MSFDAITLDSEKAQETGIPDHTRKTFLDKRGMLVIDYGNLYHIVHPDDIKKINEENVKGEFICKDVEAQYLVVENGMFTLRIIPQKFVITEGSQYD